MLRGGLGMVTQVPWSLCQAIGAKGFQTISDTDRSEKRDDQAAITFGQACR